MKREYDSPIPHGHQYVLVPVGDKTSGRNVYCTKTNQRGGHVHRSANIHSTVWLPPGSVVCRDAVIGPGVTITGKVIIQEGCHVGAIDDSGGVVIMEGSLVARGTVSLAGKNEILIIENKGAL